MRSGADKFTGCGSLRFFVDITKSIRQSAEGTAEHVMRTVLFTSEPVSNTLGAGKKVLLSSQQSWKL